MTLDAEPAARHVGLEAEAVSFSYGRRSLFEALSLRIDPGEMVGLIGANGSGKTTFLRIASGVLAPASGAVRVAGRDVATIPPRERAKMIGVVPQESRLTFDFSALEVVLMGRAAYWGLLGFEGPRDLRAAHRAMARTGTSALAGRPIGQLSGGERQLVYVARALAQEPGLLLLDEPTAFLDIRHRLEIYAILSELNREEGITVALTSHDIDLAARFCRRLVLIKEGRVIADGETSEIFTAENLSSLYDTPLRVIRDPATGEMLAVPARTGGPAS